MSSRPAVVWFRNDLRLNDNPALRHAIQEHSQVIPLFVWAPEEESPWAPGAASRWWLHQSIRNLSADLERRGSNLIIRKGPSDDVLISIARETGAQAIYWNRRYEPSLIARDAKLKQGLRDAGLIAESFPGNILFEPWTIRNAGGKPFQVFTAFWRACQSASASVPVPKPAPRSVPGPINRPSSIPLADLGLEPATDWAAGFREVWIPGEAGAAKALAEFVAARIPKYAVERDRPDHDGTSRLSPHLHFGEISVRQVWHAVQDAEAYSRQIGWREFAHHLLYHFPQTPNEPLRREFSRFPWEMNAVHYSAWTKGCTGYPLVDAGMRELWRTGWMHNRVRMLVASFLVKHLLIPWQEGAAWFWDTLVDADLANNTSGWQWSAGCGADAAPYFRIFNPVLQGQKFDPDGAYVRRWVPELSRLPAKWIHQPWQAPAAELLAAGVGLGKDYPVPIVSHDKARKRALAALAEIGRSASPG